MIGQSPAIPLIHIHDLSGFRLRRNPAVAPRSAHAMWAEGGGGGGGGGVKQLSVRQHEEMVTWPPWIEKRRLEQWPVRL